MKQHHKIFFDGATKESNPSQKIGYGVVFDDEEHLGSYYSNAGELTNNLAEYYGFLLSLRLIEKKNPKIPIIIHSDSKLVIKQMSGDWKIKEGGYTKVAKACKNLFNTLQKRYDITLTWIPRKENEHADKLSKDALLT